MHKNTCATHIYLGSLVSRQMLQFARVIACKVACQVPNTMNGLDDNVHTASSVLGQRKPAAHRKALELHLPRCHCSQDFQC